MVNRRIQGAAVHHYTSTDHASYARHDPSIDVGDGVRTGAGRALVETRRAERIGQHEAREAHQHHPDATHDQCWASSSGTTRVLERLRGQQARGLPHPLARTQRGRLRAFGARNGSCEHQRRGNQTSGSTNGQHVGHESSKHRASSAGGVLPAQMSTDEHSLRATQPFEESAGWAEAEASCAPEQHWRMAATRAVHPPPYHDVVDAFALERELKWRKASG